MDKRKDEKVNKDKSNIEKPKEEGKQIKLGVFEEDDYFEEFEHNKNLIEKKDENELKQWQADWEDEEINDNFEEILKSELSNSLK
jgi:26 proteasome complex subunit DSS1